MKAGRSLSLLLLCGLFCIIGCHHKKRAKKMHPPSPTAAEPPPPRPTGRAWLVGTQPEPPGFGLYSYLLFGSEPSDATRPLYVAIAKASLGKVEPIERKIESGFAPAQLNLYLIPLYKDPPPGLSTDDLAKWIVDNYSYSRAQRILGAVPNRGTGVYIVSVLGKPLDPSHQLAPPYLWQDLSHVEPALAAAWMQYFIDQAAKDKPWDENRGEKLALDLRNYIEIAANQVNATLPAMATALKWFKPGS